MKKVLCNTGFLQNDSPEDFSHSFMYALHQMHFLIQKHLEHILVAKKSVTFSQFMILVGFKCSDKNPVSQTTIATHLELTEATVSRHIGTLVSLGYIQREEDKNNRRKHVLSMTLEGRAVFKQAKEIIDSELVRLFSSITSPERNNIMKSFETVLNDLLKKK